MTAQSSATSALPARAERVAAILPPLAVTAQRLAATVAQGVHGRRRVGPGETFWQFRRYQPGDAVARIDWRRSAKSDPVFVRETEWRAAASVFLWRDGSPSMRYRSDRSHPEKIERADLVLLALAALLARGEENVSLLGGPALPNRSTAGLGMLYAALDRLAESEPPDVDLPRHARVVLISDFFVEPGKWEAVIRRLAARAISGHLLQIVDPAEETLPFSGRVRFEGLEREGSVILDRVEVLRAEYAGHLAQHRAALSQIARRAGWSFAFHRTHLPAETALLPLYAAMAEKPHG